MAYLTNEQGDLIPGRVAVLITSVVVFLLLGLPILFGTWGTVGAGERGVLLRFGAVAGVKEEGLYFKLPWIEKVRIMDVKVQKEEVEASAASRDLQDVSSVIAVNYHLAPDKVTAVYRDVGVDYKERLIDPAIQEAVKAATAEYTAEELITKREIVRDSIQSNLLERLTAHGINIDELNIVDFDFSESFNAAIEAKVTAEQNALAAKNKLEQSKYEAEQRIAQARGEAEAISIQARAITQQGGPEYVRLKAVEKWNGTVPHYIGGGEVIPFLNVGQ